MPMPKAAMHQDDLPVPRQDNVGRPRKPADVQPIPIPQSMDETAYDDLRFSAPLRDGGHHSASRVLVNGIQETVSLQRRRSPTYSLPFRAAASAAGIYDHTVSLLLDVVTDMPNELPKVDHDYPLCVFEVFQRVVSAQCGK